MENKQAEAIRIIDALGGPTAVSGMCSGASPQAVYEWKKKGIPPARRDFLQLKRPDLFNAGNKKARTRKH